MNFEALGRISKHKAFKTTLFIIVLLGTSYYYNYHEIIGYRPTSIHQWRNCVSASIALNYAHEGDFFHPRTHNMQVDDYTSDITLTEFPLIYFFVGTLYKIFGFHEYIYRLINILIGFAGLYFIFLLGLKAFRNTLYALLLPLLIFSSPIYIYYTNNFIPDATSLSVALVGLYFFYTFYAGGKNKDVILSLVFLGFAGLLKTPALLLFFALGGLFFLERVVKIKFIEKGFVFSKWPLHLITFVLISFLIFTWYAYAKIYTDNHGGVVSLVEIRPIWALSSDYIKEIWSALTNRFWDGIYHSPVFLILCFVLLIHNLVCWKKYDRILSSLVVLTFIGGICFTLLFYRSMKQHDYYQMNNLIIPVLIFINFIVYLKNNQKTIYTSWITKSILAAFVIFLIYSGGRIINSHYYNSWIHQYTEQNYNEKYGDITPYLRSLGIERTDKVYCTPDPSINISLYLMDQKGFTDFQRKDQSFREKVEEFSSYGCRYVIIGDQNSMDTQPEEIGLYKIGEYNGTTIYKISKENTD